MSISKIITAGLLLAVLSLLIPTASVSADNALFRENLEAYYRLSFQAIVAEEEGKTLLLEQFLDDMLVVVEVVVEHAPEEPDVLIDLSNQLLFLSEYAIELFDAGDPFLSSVINQTNIVGWFTLEWTGYRGPYFAWLSSSFGNAGEELTGYGRLFVGTSTVHVRSRGGAYTTSIGVFSDGDSFDFIFPTELFNASGTPVTVIPGEYRVQFEDEETARHDWLLYTVLQ